jgi:hypothetical protein
MFKRSRGTGGSALRLNIEIDGAGKRRPLCAKMRRTGIGFAHASRA